MGSFKRYIIVKYRCAEVYDKINGLIACNSVPPYSAFIYFSGLANNTNLIHISNYKFHSSVGIAVESQIYSPTPMPTKPSRPDAKLINRPLSSVQSIFFSYHSSSYELPSRKLVPYIISLLALLSYLS